jgi:Concanavalin A-like lectin/glucanases superfamily
MADTQFHGLETADAPNDWTLPGSLEMTLKAARAVFDGSAATSSFLPALEIISDSGLPVGTYVADTAVEAGSSADASFAPFLRRATASSGGGSALDQLIVSLAPSAWYKLNEQLGLIAHDSSVNHFDASAGSSATAPAWGQPGGPPNVSAAGFESTPNKTLEQNGAFPAISSGDLSAVAWVKRTNTGLAICIGQGDPISNIDGWQLYCQASTGVPHNTPSVQVEISGVSTTLAADNPLAVGQWAMLSTVFEAGVWSLYVNDTVQSNTLTGSPVPVTGLNMGQGSLATVASDMDLQYVQVYNYALTPADIAALYHTA